MVHGVLCLAARRRHCEARVPIHFCATGLPVVSVNLGHPMDDRVCAVLNPTLVLSAIQGQKALGAVLLKIVE